MTAAEQAAPHPLTVIRERKGWTYEQTAQRIARIAGAAGTPMAANRQKVWRWEHGGVTPDSASQLALAAALGIDKDHVVPGTWPRWLADAAGAGPDTPTCEELSAARRRYRGQTIPEARAQAAERLVATWLDWCKASRSGNWREANRLSRQGIAHATAYEERVVRLSLGKTAEAGS
ncbi:hypothetical protein [Parafrankia sp. EUN1f]|uniref:hypothetical protein n=1 Tax=Parafrankia sp. EUN1f TaxID=102897 RepID=UPI0001C46D1E|nr:hypothetical protein [Parafrankia sp. EUN1f]EFC80076.1 hypothetical protein FrEUN1fDRAFT_6803 [Parafrankia sp. EUN1f]